MSRKSFHPQGQDPPKEMMNFALEFLSGHIINATLLAFFYFFHEYSFVVYLLIFLIVSRHGKIIRQKYKIEKSVLISITYGKISLEN